MHTSVATSVGVSAAARDRKGGLQNLHELTEEVGVSPWRGLKRTRIICAMSNTPYGIVRASFNEHLVTSAQEILSSLVVLFCRTCSTPSRSRSQTASPTPLTQRPNRYVFPGQKYELCGTRAANFFRGIKYSTSSMIRTLRVHCEKKRRGFCQNNIPGVQYSSGVGTRRITMDTVNGVVCGPESSSWPAAGPCQVDAMSLSLEVVT